MSHSRRFDSLLPKLLTKVINEAVAQGRTVDGNFVDAAQRILAEKLAQGTITDKEIRQIVLLSAPRSASAQPPEPAAAAKATSSLPAVQSVVDRRDEAPQQQEARPTAKSTPPAPLFNTTKRQRQLLADQEWISQAERDRENAAIGRIQERVDKTTTQSNQRGALDRQMSEWEAQKAEERRLKRKAQDDMTRAIAEAREAARQERENAFQKAQKEKRFREQQAADMERTREEQRVQEHNDQIRHMMMLQAEMQRQREEEIAQKLREQQEWKQVLAENAQRLQEKSVQKEQQRSEDRHFQRIYVENLEREERERAQVKARKEARAAMFQAMANTVATMHMKKVQNVDDKIEAEYEEQLRRAQEDELNRKTMAKQRILETQRVLEVQKAQLKEQRDREREEAKQLADAMARQAKEAELQERNRKLAARAEAARMKEFLSTQLQLQHFRETRPLETSITRPESRAATMYSPSRYTPSPKPL